MLTPESTIPLKYYPEFCRYSTPSLIKDNISYHSVARVRKFLKDKGLEFVMEEVN